MRAVKVIVFGTLFSITGIVGLLVLIAVVRGPVVDTGSAHATGLSAVLAGLIEATVFSPVCWLVIVLAFGLAFWVVRRQGRSVAR
jgi:hypothetical protein